MSLEDKLFWYRFRPNSIENEKGKIKMILLPRIKKIVDGGLNLNFLFYGSPGLGKTTLATILTENTDCLRINCRLDGLDYVREKCDDHCKHYGVFNENKEKVIWLEEFDGASWQMREALRPMIELYKGEVKFIATANSLANFNSDKDKAVLSRFNIVKFDPNDESEKDFLKKSQLQFCKAITSKIDLKVPDEILEKIINSNFPDFRKTVQHIQELHILNGDYSMWESKTETQNSDLFDFLLNGKNDVHENYYFIMDNYKDNTQEIMQQLSKPFFNYLEKQQPKIIVNKGIELLKILKQYNAEYLNTIDAEIHVISYITEIKKTINQ